MSAPRPAVRAALVLALASACAHRARAPEAVEEPVAAAAAREAPAAAVPAAPAPPAPATASPAPAVKSPPKPPAAKAAPKAAAPKVARTPAVKPPSPSPVAARPAPRPPPPKAPPPVQARSGAPERLREPAPATTSWSAEGCLTARGEEDALRFARERRAAGGPAVTLEPRPGGLVVVHRLAHAGCLAAQVTSRAEGGRIVVSERLSGRACRPVCDSTIRTLVAAPPGASRVAVDVYAGGGNRRVFEGTVVVPPAAAGVTRR